MTPDALVFIKELLAKAGQYKVAKMIDGLRTRFPAAAADFTTDVVDPIERGEVDPNVVVLHRVREGALLHIERLKAERSGMRDARMAAVTQYEQLQVRGDMRVT